ncbi:MAG: hypothetical protein K2N48_02315 [Muribaculaceae bacterium]|nr:hypothetical protein [Muribaculaceae bacterium]
MAKFDNKPRTTTSTQIRNMFSEGMSYLNIKFFNTSLSFQFSPFRGKDPTGRSKYDFKNQQSTSTGIDGAYALYKVAKDILDGKITDVDMSIPCAGNAQLSIKRMIGQSGKYETIFAITKNNVVIPFRFHTIDITVYENGQPVVKTIESELGAFAKTIEGYLTGINADRHLDKLTEDYAALQQAQGQGKPQYSGASYQQPKQQWQPQQPFVPNGQQQWQPGSQQNPQGISGYQLPQ